MSLILVDSTVIVHLLRRYAPAVVWHGSQSQRVTISSITWLEVMEGTTSKANQAYSKKLLDQFDILHPVSIDYQWAMQQLQKFQFSHHIGKEDCLIAAVAHRLQVPLHTHNLKHMTPLLGILAVKPYV